MSNRSANEEFLCNQLELFKQNEATVSPTGSLRYNKGKPEMCQIHPRFLLEMAQLLTDAQKKYGKFNFAKGQHYTTMYDSLQRHSLSFYEGEDCDPESGRPHLVHIAVNAMMMYVSTLINDKNPELGLDDRPFKSK